MTRTIPNSGIITGQDFADDVKQAVKELFDASCFPLTAIGGTGNAITATLTPVFDPDVLVTGMKFTFTVVNNNTGPATLNINSTSAIPIVDKEGSAIPSGELLAGSRILIEYDGSDFRILNQISTNIDNLPYFEEFLSSGTWNKPEGYSDNTLVRVEVVGGGGGGGRGAFAQAGGGGGGGGSAIAFFKMIDLPSSVTVTIGAGGFGATSVTGGGGGTSSFGTLVFAYGGAGGSADGSGGGGGGNQSSGTTTIGGKIGGGDGSTTDNGSDCGVITGGGGGGGGGGNGASGSGGNSIYGGGGGGNGGANGHPGGISSFGGNGGAKQVAGSVPGGGGGGGYSQVNGAAGASGRVRIYI